MLSRHAMVVSAGTFCLLELFLRHICYYVDQQSSVHLVRSEYL